MANKKKSSSNTRSRSTSTNRRTTNNTTKGRSQRKSPVVQDEFNEDLVNEIIIIGVVALAILLFLCNFGILGSVGDMVSNIMFGLFGILSYIVPVLAAFMVFFSVANSGNPKVIRRNIAIVLMYLNISLGFELVQNTVSYGNHLGEFKQAVEEIWALSFGQHKGGGLFAGILTNLLVRWLGNVGAILLAAVVIIICIVVITEKSLFGGVRKVSDRSRRALESGSRNFSDNAERFNEQREERRLRLQEEREKKEADRLRKEEIRRKKEAEKRLKEEQIEDEKILNATVVSGTPTFTLVKEDEVLKERDDIHEINLNDIETEYDNRNGIKVHGLDSSNIDSSDEMNEIASFDKFREEHDRLSNIFSDSVTDLETSSENIPEINLANNFDESEDDGFDGMSEISFHDNDGYGMDQKSDIHYAHEDTKADVDAPKPVRSVASSAASGSIFRDGHDNPTNGGRTFGTSSGTASDMKEPEIKKKPVKPYKKPPISLLKAGDNSKKDNKNELLATAKKLEEVLSSFNVKAKVTDVSQGPAVTRYEMIPETGVKVSKILSLSDDLKLNLAAADIRIEAPIPGKAAIGIEVPNKESTAVALRDLIDSKEFKESDSKISFAVGKDLTGHVVVTDIAKMPHMLIAGATGSGKSVCINTLIMSILYKANPSEVKLIMIDPKVVELSVYNGIPHLLIPVVTDPRKANASLAWAVKEMDDRYQKFAEYGVRDLKGYNAKIENEKDINGNPIPKMFQLVVIVDELADLMMVAGKEVEESICRLAQLARAAGIHLIIATQRPSVDVITGLIKANMPSRISFAVSSGVDSRTILDMVGAEKLLGKGDMLFYPQNYTKPARVQGAFVSDKEVSDVVEFLKSNGSGEEDRSQEISAQISGMANSGSSAGSSKSMDDGSSSGQDEFFYDAGRLITESGKCSIGMLQRKFKIGFNRAARIMDALADAGVVGPDEGTKARAILMTPEQFENFTEQGY